MGRTEIRAARALEKNPIEACNEIQRRFYTELFNRFGRIVDPRHQSYITYTSKIMLGQMYYKGIAGIILFSTLEKNKEKNIRLNSGFSSLFVFKKCCMETILIKFFNFFI